jgi:hypothetical protein
MIFAVLIFLIGCITNLQICSALGGIDTTGWKGILSNGTEGIVSGIQRRPRAHEGDQGGRIGGARFEGEAGERLKGTPTFYELKFIGVT